MDRLRFIRNNLASAALLFASKLNQLPFTKEGSTFGEEEVGFNHLSN